MLHYVRMILSNASEQEITPTANAEDLATKANLLAAIVESSEDAIIGETLDGSISSWNKGAKKMFGYGSEEVIGQPVLMIIPKERADELSQLTVKIKEGKSVPHYETVRVGKDGSLMDVSVSLSPIHDSQQKLVGAAAIYRSITERKQASRPQSTAPSMPISARLETAMSLTWHLTPPSPARRAGTACCSFRQSPAPRRWK